MGTGGGFGGQGRAGGEVGSRPERVCAWAGAAAFPGATAGTEPDGAVVLETDLYRVRIDPARGGTIASLIAKDGNREFVDTAGERRFNEYRGYFVAQQKWASRADNQATVTITD